MRPIRDPRELPADLPAPADDGACDHLIGRRLPNISLPGTDGVAHDLATESRGRCVVVFAYPRTGRPGEEALGGQAAWDRTPGARGCTPQNLGYAAVSAEFAELGVTIFGLSAQHTDYQREAVTRLALDHVLLSDASFSLTGALGLPTFVVAGHRLLRRHTLVLYDGVVRHVRYPVFPPDEDAAMTLAWLRRQVR